MSDDESPPARERDVYDVVVPTEYERMVDVEAHPSESTKTEAKVQAKADVELDDDEQLRSTGIALDKSTYYKVAVTFGRELATTVEAAHPQEARRKAVERVDFKDGESVAAKPQVSLAPEDRHVDG